MIFEIVHTQDNNVILVESNNAPTAAWELFEMLNDTFPADTYSIAHYGQYENAVVFY